VKKYILLLIFQVIISTISAQHEPNNIYWEIFNVSNSGLTNNQVNSVTIDNEGTKWIATGNGICTFQDSGWETLFPFPNTNSIKCISIDSYQRKWIGSNDEEGLAIFNDTTFSIYDFINSPMPNSHVQSIAIDLSNYGWIGTYDGLARFDGFDDWTIYKTTNSFLLNDDIKCIAIDQENNKWIGTFAGLCMFDGFNWSNYLLSKTVLSIAIDSNGIKWIGTSNGLIEINDSVFTYYYPFNSGLPDDYITSIALDENGNKWIGTYQGGLVYFNGVDWIVYDTSNSELPTNWIQSITVDDFNNKWIGTYMDGLVLFNENGITSTNDKHVSKKLFSFYPNPVDDYLFVSRNNIDLKEDEPTNIFVYNNLGEKVCQAKWLTKQKSIKLNISFLKSGIYFIIIKSNYYVINQRSIIKI